MRVNSAHCVSDSGLCVQASNNLTVIQIKQDPLDASNPHSS